MNGCECVSERVRAETADDCLHLKISSILVGVINRNRMIGDIGTRNWAKCKHTRNADWAKNYRSVCVLKQSLIHVYRKQVRCWASEMQSFWLHSAWWWYWLVWQTACAPREAIPGDRAAHGCHMIVNYTKVVRSCSLSICCSLHLTERRGRERGRKEARLRKWSAGTSQWHSNGLCA